MLCNECSKRAFCSCLCPEAELYANQDQVSQREKPIGLPKTGRFPTPKIRVKLTKREKQIVQYLAEGMTTREIAEVANITIENTWKICQRLKNKLS